MNKLFSFILIAFSIIILGCNNDNKYSNETYIKADSLWVENKGEIGDFLDGVVTHDIEFLAQQHIEGKVKNVDKKVMIEVMDELNNGKIVQIKFLQGRYKNKTGYTLSEWIKDEEEERERKIALENERMEAEKQYAEQISEAEKKRYDLLVKNGVQFNFNPVENTSSTYRKISGTTNLPDGTKLRIIISNIDRTTTVKNGNFSVLFERTVVTVGEHDFSIKTLDKSLQPANVKLTDENIVSNGRDSILGKRIYLDKINVK